MEIYGNLEQDAPYFMIEWVALLKPRV